MWPHRRSRYMFAAHNHSHASTLRPRPLFFGPLQLCTSFLPSRRSGWRTRTSQLLTTHTPSLLNRSRVAGSRSKQPRAHEAPSRRRQCDRPDSMSQQNPTLALDRRTDWSVLQQASFLYDEGLRYAHPIALARRSARATVRKQCRCETKTTHDVTTVIRRAQWLSHIPARSASTDPKAAARELFASVHSQRLSHRVAHPLWA